MKLSHGRDRSSISILGSITNIGSTIAGIAGRLFSPVIPPNEQFEGRLFIDRPPRDLDYDVPKSSSTSLLSVMADEQAAFWELLESAPEKPPLSQPNWYLRLYQGIVNIC